MNLEYLKVKAKRKDNGKWIKGYYVYGDRNTKHFIFVKGWIFGVWVDSERILDYVEEGIYEIDPKTICRLVYKDDKEEIWENDIIVREGSKKPFVVKIPNIYFPTVEKGKLKVVGNIFDNPELLEEV